MKHHYSPKSGKTLARQNRMRKKLAPTEAHQVVKDYIRIKAGKHSTFMSVNDLLVVRKVSRNLPRKMKKRFDILWKEFYPDKDIDYKINIFLERAKVRRHRVLPKEAEYEKFIWTYPRGGHQTYTARCLQRDIKPKIKEWMYYYYKEAVKTKTRSSAPNKKAVKYKESAKEWYGRLYEKYDFVIHIDGKSMEDQEYIWKNPKLKFEAKRLSLAVEAKSWIIVWIWIEKSHNKTNAWNIFRQICDHIENTFGTEKKICFVTDAGSEYLNNRDLRGLDITDKDTSKMASYLREKWHGWRITRRPEDNSFVENKNDYIERACLDNKEILDADYYSFMCFLEDFLQRNNRFLSWSKGSFRGKGIIPEENIQWRFWIKKWKKWVAWIHVQKIEKILTLNNEHKNHTMISILDLCKKYVRPLKRKGKNCLFYQIDMMHPKSLDFSSRESFTRKFY